ncbi:hypothetical protein FDECE_7227 [Fusarium decemcellulare]|nr:hypothetical protein FDECE_7227 [Fusarium decemcellulare]
MGPCRKQAASASDSPWAYDSDKEVPDGRRGRKKLTPHAPMAFRKDEVPFIIPSHCVAPLISGLCVVPINPRATTPHKQEEASKRGEPHAPPQVGVAPPYRTRSAVVDVVCFRPQTRDGMDGRLGLDGTRWKGREPDRPLVVGGDMKASGQRQLESAPCLGPAVRAPSSGAPFPARSKSSRA